MNTNVLFVYGKFLGRKLQGNKYQAMTSLKNTHELNIEVDSCNIILLVF